MVSYGVHPEWVETRPQDWRAFAEGWLHDHEIEGHVVMVTEGPSIGAPDANDRLELLDLSR